MNADPASQIATALLNEEWRRRPLRALLRIYAGRWKGIAGGMILMLVSSAAAVAAPFVIRQGVQGILAGDQTQVRWLFLMSVGLTILHLGAGYFGELLVVIASERSSLVLRNILTWHVLGMPMEFFRTNQTGYIMGRIKEVGEFGEQLLQMAFKFLRYALLANVCLLFIVTQLPKGSPSETVAVALIMAGMLFVGFFFARRIKAASRTRLEKWTHYDRSLKEIVARIGTLKSLCAEREQFRRIMSDADRGTESLIHVARIGAVARLTIGSLTFCLPLLGLAFGGATTLQQQMTFPEFVQLLLFIGLLASSARECFSSFMYMHKVGANLERISDILSKPAADPDHASSPIPAPGPGHQPVISLRDVRMQYPGRPPLFTDVSLSVHAKEKIGLAGHNGAGKTTLFALLMRLENPTGGSITIRGTEIRDIDAGALRRFIAVVPQDPFLLNGTIRENLVLGLERQVDRAEIVEVLGNVGLKGLVDRLDGGLDTTVGEDGRELSQGERKRLAVARCVLRRPAVVLLDEATESLDEVYREVIPSLLEKEFRDCIVIRVSHRWEELKDCDVIYRLEGGRLQRLKSPVGAESRE